MARVPSLIRTTLAWLRRLFAPCFACEPDEVRGAVEVDPTLVVETARDAVHVVSETPAIRLTDTRPRLRVSLVLREVSPELLIRTLASAGVTGLAEPSNPGRRA